MTPPDNSEGPFGLFTWLLSDAGTAALAGAAGGLVRWLTLRESMRDGAITLLVGCLCALYLGPLAVPLIEPVIGKISPSADAAGFSAFIIGLGGISISGFLIDIIRLRRQQITEDEDA